jgi:hypothetical protein
VIPSTRAVSGTPADHDRGLVALLLLIAALAARDVVEQLVLTYAGGLGQGRGTSHDRRHQVHHAIAIHAAQCAPPGAA